MLPGAGCSPISAPAVGAGRYPDHVRGPARQVRAGAVWAFAAQVELGRDYDVPRRRGATAVVVALALVLGVGLLTAAVALPLASAGAARQYWWALAISPLILIGLLPPVLGRLLDRVIGLVGWQPLERRPSARGVARALAWTTLGWLLWGLSLAARQGYNGARGPSLAARVRRLCDRVVGGHLDRRVSRRGRAAGTGPGGRAGARHARGAALVIALISRVVMTTSDLIWGTVGSRSAAGAARAPAPAALNRYGRRLVKPPSRPDPGRRPVPPHRAAAPRA